MQTILQNANPASSNGQTTMPTIAPTQSHTIGSDLPGTPSGQGNLDIVTIGSGYGFVAEKGTSAEGGVRQPLNLVTADGFSKIVNPA
jgi:hypothetical protein